MIENNIYNLIYCSHRYTHELEKKVKELSQKVQEQKSLITSLKTSENQLKKRNSDVEKKIKTEITNLHASQKKQEDLKDITAKQQVEIKRLINEVNIFRDLQKKNEQVFFLIYIIIIFIYNIFSLFLLKYIIHQLQYFYL